MNNALKYSWTNGDIALTVEDDWILQKKLDLTHFVKVLSGDSDVGMIRLCYLDSAHALEQYDEGLKCVRKSKNNFIFNNQCGIRHRRIYDFIGYNKENCSGDYQESYIRDRYNKLTNFGETYKVLWPSEIKVGTMDDPSLYFVHVGKSVSGHGFYDIPTRYLWIYGDSWKNEISSMLTDVFFRIIIPTYNISKFLKRCLDSISH